MIYKNNLNLLNNDYYYNLDLYIKIIIFVL